VQFFLLDFLGNEAEINLDLAKDREFSQWKWATASEVVENIVEFKRDAYLRAAKELELI
jgi:putative (di)nucleoside polyphosphate hydrolase